MGARVHQQPKTTPFLCCTSASANTRSDALLLGNSPSPTHPPAQVEETWSQAPPDRPARAGPSSDPGRILIHALQQV